MSSVNPLRMQLPPAVEHGDPAELRSRFPMNLPSPEEFSRLQELLAQALKREAEAHRKMKHLYEQLVSVQSSRNRSSLSEGESRSI